MATDLPQDLIDAINEHQQHAQEAPPASTPSSREEAMWRSMGAWADRWGTARD